MTPAAGGLVVEALTVARGGHTLFKNLSLRLGPGGAARVTGANGAGKSSLIRVLAGLLRAQGSVTLVDDTAHWPMPLALMTEAHALDGERCLRDALLFWASLDRGGAAAIRVDAAMNAVALAPLAHVPVRLLSTGQRRRAAIARVVAAQARLWLLDEPANGLDHLAIATLEALIAKHRAAGGIIIVATHQPIALPDAVEVAL